MKKPTADEKKKALRRFVLDLAKENGIDPESHSDVTQFLVERVGDDFRATAARILKLETGGDVGTYDRIAKAFGKRFDPAANPTTAVYHQLHPTKGDPKPKRAADLNRLAPIAKRATKSDLARLADEAAADPADVKLVAMMLLMFRDA